MQLKMQQLGILRRASTYDLNVNRLQIHTHIHAHTRSITSTRQSKRNICIKKKEEE